MSTPTGTIASQLGRGDNGFDARSGDFDILNAALRAAGLDAALADPDAHLTVLAPTDAAFVSLARSLGYEGTDEQGAFDAIVAALTNLAPDGNPIPLLTQVLSYHVLPQVLDRRDIASTPELPTLLADATLRPFGGALQDGDPDAADARLVGRTIETRNGNIQAIDEVLLPIDLPGNADGLPVPLTIAGIVAASGTGFDSEPGDFDLLLRAVQDAGLVDALADPEADLTVLAPTDAAFIQLARSLGFAGDDEAGAYDAIVAALTDLGGGNPIPLLTDILTYHVLPGRLDTVQLDAAGPIATLNGATLEVDRARIVDAEPDLRDARFVPGATDIEAANGAVQAIDRVLLPFDLELGGDGVGGTIADQLAASGTGFDANSADFDILNAALNAAGLAGELDGVDAEFTLFAPTDAAFLRLARDLGYAGREEQGAFDQIVASLTALSPDGNPIPLLTDILTYHVAEGSLTAAEIAASPGIATLSGETISPFGRQLIDLDPTLPDARIIARRADLPASNGTIQAIDRVLLPTDVPEARGGAAPPPTLAALVDASGEGFDGNRHDFDILEAALEAAGLDAALADTAAELTLLAPTDAAFVSLAQRLGHQGNSEAGAFDAIVQALTGLGGGDPIPVLTDILSYHVLDGRASRQQLAAEGSAETLLGPELGFRGNLIIDAEPGYQVRFEGPGNVLAQNGALHAIGEVLLPLNLDVI